MRVVFFFVCVTLTLPLCVAELRWEAWWEVDCVWRASGHAVDREHELCNGWQQSPHTHQRRENLHARTGTGARRYPAHTKTSNAARPGLFHFWFQTWYCALHLTNPSGYNRELFSISFTYDLFHQYWVNLVKKCLRHIKKAIIQRFGFSKNFYF